MRKLASGVAIIAAATLLSIYSLPAHKEETAPVVSFEETENQISELQKGEVFVLPTNQVPVTLVDTIDGDTIKVKVNNKIETVRYLLIDTPESKKPGVCVQPYAKDAFQRNNKVVRGGSLSLEYEEGNTRDAYGRLLAYVYVDGQSVQETLLQEGYARVAYIMEPPYKFLARFRADESLAKRNKVHIWSDPEFVTNWGFVGCDTW